MLRGEHKYQLPPNLSDQDTIGIVAPASAGEKSKVEAGIEYLKKQGFKVKKAPNLTNRLKYLAANDAKRIQYLVDFLRDDEISALFCLRGGYGTMRLLDKLDFAGLSKLGPKIIMGYSDITALQFSFLKKLNWITFSGPMVASDMDDNLTSYTGQWMWKVLKKSSGSLILKNPKDKKMKVYRSGKTQGVLLPGCLSIITTIMRTEYCPSFENCILVLEDIGETGYKLDRLLTTLKLHGVFDQIAGLILGSFQSTDDELSQNSFPLFDLLDDIIGNYEFPVITNFAYGHISNKLTLPVGIRASLNTDPLNIKIFYSE
ncbi:MAG: LD-carboxypeptidase [Candidatus Marinimicrobia bacterium]|nr:LD-carboxypeptidase [Candidatus Neomarinimicrobiota bacterium]